MERLHSSTGLEYDLYQEADGTLVLSVLCGTFAMYDARIRLNQDETKQYHEHGVDFLDELAQDIRKQESKYRLRFI